MNTGTISSPNLVFHHLWDFCSPKCQTNPNPLIICRSQQSIINGLTFYEVNFVTIISHYAFNISHILIMVFWENTQNQHIKDPCNALHLQSSWIIVSGILARRKSTACPQVYAVYKLKGHYAPFSCSLKSAYIWQRSKHDPPSGVEMYKFHYICGLAYKDHILYTTRWV